MSNLVTTAGVARVDKEPWYDIGGRSCSSLYLVVGTYLQLISIKGGCWGVSRGERVGAIYFLELKKELIIQIQVTLQ